MTIDEAISHEERNVEINKLIGEVSDCEPTNAIAYHRQLVEWLKELKQLREQTRWIPVSERLPYNHEYIQNNGLFNVSDGNRSYSEWFDIYDTQKFGEPTMNGFRVDYAVTAWMPLPEPYRAESEDKNEKETC